MPMAVAICSKFDCSYVVIGNAVAVAASLCMGALGAEVDTSSPGARCNRGAHDAPDLLPAPVADLLESTYMAKSFLVPEAPPFRIAHWFVPAVIRLGADPQRNFRFFDNRQKYLLFVNTCSEKWVIAHRVALELANNAVRGVERRDLCRASRG